MDQKMRKKKSAPNSLVFEGQRPLTLGRQPTEGFFLIHCRFLWALVWYFDKQPNAQDESNPFTGDQTMVWRGLDKKISGKKKVLQIS